jgi:hypothetical protein
MKKLSFDDIAFVDAYAAAVASASRTEVVRFLSADSEERCSREFCDSMDSVYTSIADAHEVWFRALKHARKNKGMTVGTLSAALANLPQDLPVLIWDAGTRLQIAHIDDTFVEDENPRLEFNTDRDD